MYRRQADSEERMQYPAMVHVKPLGARFAGLELSPEMTALWKYNPLSAGNADGLKMSGSLNRLIGKWLKVGVLDGVELFHPEMGTPQGGVISPLLANIYLHEMLDIWFDEVAKPRGRLWSVKFKYFL